MNENARKKREWVKTAAIIFLSVMLVLTFFSNTIMNYSLPEVAIQYVQSGTVTAKIRGSGVVESGDPYNIEVKESRKVDSVAVRVGDFVEKGDVILYLADEESEELQAAQDALDQAWKDYEKLLLSETTTAAGIQAANSGTSTATFRQQITNAQNAVTAAQKRVDELQERYEAFSLQLAITPGNDADMGDLEKWMNEAKAALDNATYAEQAALNTLNALTADKKMYGAQVSYYEGIIKAIKGEDADEDADPPAPTPAPEGTASAGQQRSIYMTSETGAIPDQDNGGTPADPGTGAADAGAADPVQPSEPSTVTDPSNPADSSTPSEPQPPVLSPEDQQKIAAAEAKIAEINQKLDELGLQILTATDAYNQAVAAKAAAQLAYDKAKNAYDTQKASGDTSDTKESLQIQQAQVNIDLSRAKADLEEKKTALTELTGSITNAYGLQSQMDAITKAQEKVDELTAKSIGATVTADISGTVTAINVTAGTTTSAATPVAVLQPEGKGFSMSFSVTNEQAKRLAVGDKADLVNAWRFDDVEVTLASIKPDPNDPGQKKLLTFDVTGAVTAGQTLNISVGQKSANYDYIVPNNAIREDNNGKFILVVTSKSSPLGTRYYATRVDVEVLASDDSQSAVSSGMLTGYDPVITTSTKPVEAGKLVRLAEN